MCIRPILTSLQKPFRVREPTIIPDHSVFASILFIKGHIFLRGQKPWRVYWWMRRWSISCADLLSWQGEGDLSIATSTRLLSADAAGAFVVGLEDEFFEVGSRQKMKFTWLVTSLFLLQVRCAAVTSICGQWNCNSFHLRGKSTTWLRMSRTNGKQPSAARAGVGCCCRHALGWNRCSSSGRPSGFALWLSFALIMQILEKKIEYPAPHPL